MMTLMINSARSAYKTHADDPQNPVDLLRELELKSDAIVFLGDQQVDLISLNLKRPEDTDLVVDVEWSGISTGTERLLWSGKMPAFPGLAYPLVPGYESVGRVVHSELHRDWVGSYVFVPGANCYEHAAGLFGATSSRIIIPQSRAVRLDGSVQRNDVLLALAATAHHALNQSELPELIIGHGVLGRLMARLVIALGGRAPQVWETNVQRQDGDGYSVMHPESDVRRDYKFVCDVSGNVEAIDTAISHCGKGAEIVLAGFYADRVSFAFPAAFMREVSFKIAAEWDRSDMEAVLMLRRRGVLNLDGLVTHAETPAAAQRAYQTAFSDPDCLKMVLDWRSHHDHFA
ncbi:MAG: chlorophyll synthesis pathway protein BchC [Pseudomonadota bacterium]|nr:chlorophyll synthesis pathway protein BchC [Pseudomonadota bacterium]